jgi:hypothetical protein
MVLISVNSNVRNDCEVVIEKDKWQTLYFQSENEFENNAETIFTAFSNSDAGLIPFGGYFSFNLKKEN